MFVEEMRYEYDGILNEESIVFDVGAYQGEFSEEIFSKYKCNLFLFEPIKDNFEAIQSKFKTNSKIQVFNFGLLDIGKVEKIYIKDCASTIYKNISNKSEDCSFKDILQVMNELEISYVDLIKINIEGGEYALLKHIIDEYAQGRFKNIQVQFHDFLPNAKKMWEDISAELNKTHERTYCYEWIWENWKIK